MRTAIRKLTVAAMMAALGILLMMPMFEIPLAFFAPWLKLDFSTMPILLAGFAFGPAWGILVQLIKSIAHIPFGTTGGIGEIADLLMGISMVLPASLIYGRMRSRKGALLGMAAGTALMMIMGALTNYYLLLPLYFGTDVSGGITGALGGRDHINDLGSYITLGVLPFNLIKGTAVSAVTFLLYKRISPLLHGTWKRTRNENKPVSNNDA